MRIEPQEGRNSRFVAIREIVSRIRCHRTMPQRQMLLASAIFLTLFAFSGCGNPSTVAEGVVRNQIGEPVEEVTVVMESEVAGGYRKESEQITGPDGRFSFETTTGTATIIRLRFTKDGFEEITRKIPAHQETALDVTLEGE